MNVIDLARRSIRFRLWILLVAMSMAILAISVIIFGLYGWHSRQRQSETHLVSMAEMIALNSAAPLLFHDDETARDDLKQIKNHKDIMYVGIVDAQGRIFAEQGICINRSPDTWNRNHAAVHCRKNARLCATAPIVNQNDTIGYVHIEQELTQLNRQIATFAASALGIFLFTLLVAMALSNRIGRTITEPITHLAAMIRQVSDSRRIGSPIFVTSQDEIGDLSRGIHVMLKNLDVSRQALEKSLSLQQTLFDTIPMPVYGKKQRTPVHRHESPVCP
jgi:sensor histidine kinase regulating citrate/malate metabolism